MVWNFQHTSISRKYYYLNKVFMANYRRYWIKSVSGDINDVFTLFHNIRCSCSIYNSPQNLFQRSSPYKNFISQIMNPMNEYCNVLNIVYKCHQYLRDDKQQGFLNSYIQKFCSTMHICKSESLHFYRANIPVNLTFF